MNTEKIPSRKEVENSLNKEIVKLQEQMKKDRRSSQCRLIKEKLLIELKSYLINVKE